MRKNQPNTISAEPTIDDYITESFSSRFLSREEERDLFLRIKKGDTDAREKIITANLGLVCRVAKRFIGRGMSEDDLIQEGNIGLVKAVDGFDLSRNVWFSTYAKPTIAGEIKNALKNKMNIIGIPATIYSLIAAFRQKELSLLLELQRQPTFDEVYNQINSSYDKKRLKSALLAITTRKDECILDNTPNEYNPAEDALFLDDQHKMQWALSKIDTRSATIIKQRFGLDANDPKTLQAIGDELRITRERVRILELAALQKLRSLMEKKIQLSMYQQSA